MKVFDLIFTFEPPETAKKKAFENLYVQICTCMKCRHCDSDCIKKGFYKQIQRLFCKACNKYQQKNYQYRMCIGQDEETIVKLNNIGVGISGIAKFTGISKSNVVNKIRQIASRVIKPVFEEQGQDYEADELYTFIRNKNKGCYIMYALNKTTGKVIDYVVGARTKENISKVITSLKDLNPRKIFTDRLNIYSFLIEEKIHRSGSYKINHIERFNLNLRTHLKRLTRRTICFSRSVEMLESCLKLYLYGDTLQVKNTYF